MVEPCDEFTEIADEIQEGDGSSEGSQGKESTEENLDNYMLAIRRTIQPSLRYGQAEMIYFALQIAKLIDFPEPTSYSEAMSSREFKEGLRAMKEKIKSLFKK